MNSIAVTEPHCPCPDCEGTGTILADCPPSWAEPTHHYWRDINCPACDGTGFFTIDTEEE